MPSNLFDPEILFPKPQPSNPGAQGNNGYSPVLAVIDRGEDKVHQVIDWVGGTGTKPQIGQYISESGFTSDINEAVNIKGEAGTGGSGGSPVVVSTFAETLNFTNNRVYNPIIQEANIFFTQSEYLPLNVIYSKISVDDRYLLQFGPNFFSYRNELDGNGVYDFWFMSMPDESVVYSIIKTSDYIPDTPIVDNLPFEVDVIARYNYDNILLDGVSGKITNIINTYNNQFNLTSTTDSTRPVPDSTNKRITFAGTATTENINGITPVQFSTGNEWHVTMLVELNSENLLGSKADLLMSTNSMKVFTAYNNIGQMYLNNALKSSATDDKYLTGVIGVHKYSVNQTTTTTDYYIDDVLIVSQASSQAPLTLTNVFSQHNATKATATKIKHVYDCIVYDRSLSEAEIQQLSLYFNTKYPNFIPGGGPQMTGYQTVGITAGQNLSVGNTVNVSYTVTSGTPTKLCVIIKQGTTALKSFVVSDNLTQFTIPATGVNPTTNYFTKAFLMDAFGRTGNQIEYSAIKFNIV